MNHEETILKSIELLGEQLEHGFAMGVGLKISAKYAAAKNICIVGMGGSGLAGHIALSVFSSELKIPAFVVNDSALPRWAGPTTLVLLISYSGNTQEVLNAAKQAVKNRCMVVGITAGNMLGAWLSSRKLPLVHFATTTNPALQPRFGIGLTLGSTLGILAKLRFIALSARTITQSKSTLARVRHEHFNNARRTSRDMGAGPVLVLAAEHLGGAAHYVANQMNETAKQCAIAYLFPELAHHLLESIQPGKQTVLVLPSKLYDAPTQQHVAVSIKILKQISVHVITPQLQTKKRLDEALEVIMFGSYLAYCSAMETGVHPLSLPTVEAFKAAL